MSWHQLLQEKYIQGMGLPISHLQRVGKCHPFRGRIYVPNPSITFMLARLKVLGIGESQCQSDLEWFEIPILK